MKNMHKNLIYCFVVFSSFVLLGYHLKELEGIIDDLTSKIDYLFCFFPFLFFIYNARKFYFKGDDFYIVKTAAFGGLAAITLILLLISQPGINFEPGGISGLVSMIIDWFKWFAAGQIGEISALWLFSNLCLTLLLFIFSEDSNISGALFYFYFIASVVFGAKKLLFSAIFIVFLWVINQSILESLDLRPIASQSGITRLNGYQTYLLEYIRSRKSLPAYELETTIGEAGIESLVKPLVDTGLVNETDYGSGRVYKTGPNYNFSKYEKAKAVVRCLIVLTVTLIYCISPIDFIPDFFAPLGFFDDGGLVVIAVKYIYEQSKIILS